MSSLRRSTRPALLDLIVAVAGGLVLSKANLVEILAPRWVKLKTVNPSAERRRLRRVHKRNPGSILMDDFLGTAIETRSQISIDFDLGIDQDLVQFLAPVKRDVVRRENRSALVQQDIQEVVWIPILSRPTQ